MQHYIAIIHKEPDTDFGVSFPDFPGCVTTGETLSEAREMAVEALTGHIEVMVEYGDEIPEPSSIESIMSNSEYSDGVAVLVTVPDVQKKTRVNISVNVSDLQVIDAYAKRKRLNRSDFMVKAARKAIKENSL